MAKENDFLNNDEKLKSQNDLLEKIKFFILDNYEPSPEFSNDTILMTTSEIYSKIHFLFPSKFYKMEDVAIFLNAAGFTFYEVFEMRFAWIFKPKSTANK